MANIKHRNHFIPRFFLNRFASRLDHGKHWVWQISRDKEQREVSTRDTAVGSDFYGGPETGVEDLFASYETKYREALAKIDSGAHLNDLSEALRQIVWTFALRTRALRTQFVDTADTLISRVAESAGSRDAKAAVIEHLKLNFDKCMNDAIVDLPVPQRTVVSMFLQMPRIREGLLGRALKEVASCDLQAIFNSFACAIKDQKLLTQAAKDGQIRGLFALMQGQCAPDSFNPPCWTLLQSSSDNCVLGDSCVFAVTKDGSYGPIIGFPESWFELYLPISSSLIVVARKDVGKPNLSPEEVNKISAETASEFIYASKMTEEVTLLAKHIGNITTPLSSDEICRIVDNAWKNLNSEHS